MQRLFTRLVEEVLLTFRKPWRVIKLFDRKMFSLWIASFRRGVEPASGNTPPSFPPKNVADTSNWRQWGTSFQVRSFSAYEEYVAIQKSKLDKVVYRQKATWLQDYDVSYHAALYQRLSQCDLSWHGRNVLCLAARIGTEVRSFLDLGCFAIGIDLNPGLDNKYVVVGDFHALQFPDCCVDVVFTNSLDHVLDIQKVLGEVHRVLKPAGLLFIEAVRGTSEGVEPGRYETFFWSSIDDLTQLVTQNSFSLIARNGFDFPWPGELIQFQKASS